MHHQICLEAVKLSLEFGALIPSEGIKLAYM